MRDAGQPQSLSRLDYRGRVPAVAAARDQADKVGGDSSRPAVASIGIGRDESRSYAKTSLMQIVSKLPKVGTTIFTVMSQLAMQHQAVNLGQGFPDFDGPQSLRDALAAAMNSHKNQYAPMAGIPKLRE